MANPKPRRFAAVVSTYHSRYTEAMLASAAKALKGHVLDVVRVPGAFEVPLAVQRCARKGGKERYEAILAFGVVWEGKTRHAEEILRACTDALMRIGLENDVPVLHEILSVSTEKEAEERTRGKLDRGTEAAQAALGMAPSFEKTTARKLKGVRRTKAA
jgi:6,7-dimethyl-8-ribityllumazine synthase